jgi:phage terminase small subunit
MTKLNAKGSLRLATSTDSNIMRWAPPTMPACLPASMRPDFDRMCRNLYAEGLWHDDRLPLVVSYCAASHLIDKLSTSISVDGIHTEKGKLNPAAAALSTAVATLAKAGHTLGLTVVRYAPNVTEKPVASAETSRWANAGKAGIDG